MNWLIFVYSCLTILPDSVSIRIPTKLARLKWPCGVHFVNSICHEGYGSSQAGLAHLVGRERPQWCGASPTEAKNRGRYLVKGPGALLQQVTVPAGSDLPGR